MSVTLDDPKSFWLEARSQRVCRRCGSTGAFQAHHVVAKQTLKRERAPLYDPRNSMRLCVNCHMSFEGGGVEITLASLTQQEICFAFEALGSGAGVHLERRYAGGTDPRVTAHETDEECELCQT